VGFSPLVEGCVTKSAMRIFVLLLMSSALLACPEKKPVEMPVSGRCEVDLNSFNSFSAVGAGASAKVIDSESMLIGGESAQGRLGDVLLENDRIRVVIQQPTRTIAPVPYGGNIIDADVKRASGKDRDAFGKMGLIYHFGRTSLVDKVEVLADGSNGGYAVVAATGTDTVADFFNVNNVIHERLSDVDLVTNPNEELPLKITTYYVISPGESRVRLLTAFCNSGKTPVITEVGDMTDQGGVSDLFNPTGCTDSVPRAVSSIPPAGSDSNQMAWPMGTAPTSFWISKRRPPMH
jgi:hypothetical protein